SLSFFYANCLPGSLGSSFSLGKSFTGSLVVAATSGNGNGLYLSVGGRWASNGCQSSRILVGRRAWSFSQAGVASTSQGLWSVRLVTTLAQAFKTSILPTPGGSSSQRSLVAVYMRPGSSVATTTASLAGVKPTASAVPECGKGGPSGCRVAVCHRRTCFSR